MSLVSVCVGVCVWVNIVRITLFTLTLLFTVLMKLYRTAMVSEVRCQERILLLYHSGSDIT